MRLLGTCIKLLLLNCICFMSGAMAQGIDMNDLRGSLETHINEKQAVGLVVGVIENGRHQYVELGIADNVSLNPVDRDSIFEIGSISKVFTTILLADMVFKGEVTLDDPVSDYLPDGVMMSIGKNGNQITLGDLATHASGLPRIPDNFTPGDPTNPYVDYTDIKLYEFLSDHELERDVGERAEYSNLGMGLLGHVLSLKSGQSYEALVRERIFAPLNMNDSFVIVPDKHNDRFVTGHDAVGDPAAYWDFAVLAGAGAIRSTARDMMNFLQAITGEKETVLADAIKFSQKPIRIFDEFEDGQTKIALGWIISTDDGRTAIWHNGGTAGFRSFIGFDTASRRGVVVLTNSQDDPDMIGFSVLTGKIKELIVEKQLPVENPERYVGDYQLAPEFILSVTTDGEQLFVQATNQPNVQVHFKEKNEFFYKVVDASISFVEDENGVIKSLVLHQGGDHPAAKIK